MMSTRKTIHKLYEETLRAQFGPQVFDTRVTEVVDYVEALNQRLPVAQYKPRGAATKTMKALADEIETRLLSAREGTLFMTNSAIQEEAA
jgi:chromosome partitioning protein